MKTTTYLRFSLLIPFLVWGLCLVILFLWVTFQPNGSASEDSTAVALLGLLLLIYTFGIAVWLIPYLLLCAVLFVWSLRSRVEVLIKGFALSPFAMAILVAFSVNLLSIRDAALNTLWSNPGAFARNVLSPSILFIVVTLFWGYVCVGSGYGLYRILRRMEYIRDKTIPAAG